MSKPHAHVYRRGQSWGVRYVGKDGVRRRRSGFQSEEEVQAWFEEHRAEIAAESYSNGLGRGESHYRWNGGRKMNNGYVRMLAPNHPAADSTGRVYEHRLVMESLIGRPLRPGEVVHHINGVKDDNRPENLAFVVSAAAHARIHS